MNSMQYFDFGISFFFSMEIFFKFLFLWHAFQLRSQEKKHKNVCECKLMGGKCGNENISYNVKIRIGSDSEVCFQNPPPDVVNCR